MPRWGLILALITLVACTAGEDTRDGSARPSAVASPDRELRQAVEEYVRCLRDEGIEVSDASFDEAGRVGEWPTYELTDDARSAEESCGEGLSELAFRPRGQAAIFIEQFQEFADCMRAEGITDIEVSVDGIRIGPRSTNRDIRTAERQCRPLLQGS